MLKLSNWDIKKANRLRGKHPTQYRHKGIFVICPHQKYHIFCNLNTSEEGLVYLECNFLNKQATEIRL